MFDFWVTPFDWWSGTPIAPVIVLGNFLFWPAVFGWAWMRDEIDKRRRRKKLARAS